MQRKDFNKFDDVWLPSPAKLNLMLRIVGRREDGYHQLQTVFQFISYGDEMLFEYLTDSEISIATPLDGVPIEQDLSYRAALLLQKACGCSLGVRISNRKNLPMGGGLGGGSSNAATTLLVLNQMWSLGLSIEQLMGLGVTLGADVPVFVRGCASWAEGIGENLVCLELPEPYCLVVLPAVSVATKKIFSSPGLTRDSDPITIAAFLAGGYNTNDCLSVVSELYPDVAKAMNWLGQYGEARLTGTGACVFAFFPDNREAEKVRKLVPEGWQAYVGKMSNISPLHAALYASS